MNRWKISFFVLAGLVSAVAAALVYLIANPGESTPLPKVKIADTAENVLTVRATKEDFEEIANTYIRKAVKGEPLPVIMKITDDVILSSEMTVFSQTLPVIMHFDPIVQEDGNLILKQSSMEIGRLNIPPSTVLKVLRDSVKLPPWMIVRPKEEELFIDLSKIPVSGNLQVKAKAFNLAKDEIILEIIIPKE
ncbi:YpmS family protein [Sporosarcina limicola]|uniref:Uncharacterized protein YpmS n=1 Tax=Sporosarcina limicola TaxID=34101 RepID=A0A927MHI3_9BACL|nr:YpmS family protein [Sporosarcina limicola]MBE1554735.1 uncharacterized protein YpmS [Sporosarcina limicola]